MVRRSSRGFFQADVLTSRFLVAIEHSQKTKVTSSISKSRIAKAMVLKIDDAKLKEAL
jgi:hypothetical protein